MALFRPDENENRAIKLFGRVIAPSLENQRVLSHNQEVLGSHSEEHKQSLGSIDDSTVPSSMGINVVWEDEECDGKFLINRNPNINTNNDNNGQQVLASSCKSEMEVVQCPRCNSWETKFCYFNNYNLKQPRHFCRACHRYWTAGGNLRNVPIGAGRRKSKRPQTQTNNNKHPYPLSPPINNNNTLHIRRDSTDFTTAADLSTKEMTQDREEESGGSASSLEASSFIERGNIPLLDSLSNGGVHAGPPPPPPAPIPMMPWPVWNPYQLGGGIPPWMMMPWMAGANMSPPLAAFFPPLGPNITEEGFIPLPPPKILRIGDPDSVLKPDFPGFFSAFHPPPQIFQKNLLPTTAVFPETPLKPEYSNPVAFSRSVAFQESN